ncbi:LysR family transcriptional regulator [Lachnoclostridium sp. Marseille-P6806]|uniref:LysR family transcriptional regulator n=1 Tax=Lachnoclostridium sp. Marseille-P6806 TaxID=2364793 RepID=UPI0010307D5E|nr:LysR family transcriptional regulator [Lachnoclostridium sp. Marseille-P6806]
MTANLEWYRVFNHVAQCGSLTLAAEQLSVSQPAVSQSLKQLEGALETQLFVRSSRGVSLTREGELLWSYVRRGCDLIETGEKKLRQMQNLDIGELHIGASDMTLRFYLLPYLERFHERHPGVKVIVNNAPTPETIAMLENESIDFGVVSGPLPSLPHISAIPVREIQDCFVAARRFIQYRNRMMDLHDLEGLPLICLEQRTSSRAYIDAFMSKNGAEIHPEFQLATSDMIVQFALRNLGIGCVVRDFALDYLESGQLFELRFNKYIPKRSFYVILSRKSVLPAAATALLSLIRADLDNTAERVL